MTPRFAAIVLPAVLAACSPSGSPPSGRVETTDIQPPAAAAPSASLDEVRALASGHSFLRPAGADSYEVLYFGPGGAVSLLRAERMQIVQGRWSAEIASVGEAPEPVPAICLTLDSSGPAPPQRCLDPKLLSAGDTERARGDVLGISRWKTVPETLPREKASLDELKSRIRT